MQKFRVEFDDGTVVEGQAKSRDLVKLEDAGVNVQEVPPLRGTYLVVHAALQRMSRQGLIDDVAVPETVEGLMELADVEAVEDEADPKG